MVFCGRGLGRNWCGYVVVVIIVWTIIIYLFRLRNILCIMHAKATRRLAVSVDYIRKKKRKKKKTNPKQARLIIFHRASICISLIGGIVILVYITIIHYK